MTAGQYLCQYLELFASEDSSVNQVRTLELGPPPGDRLDQSLIPRSFDNLENKRPKQDLSFSLKNIFKQQTERKTSRQAGNIWDRKLLEALGQG